MSRVVRVIDASVDLEPLGEDAVSDDPHAGALSVTAVGEAEVGIWRMTPGVARDTEGDEAFVVVAGRASIRFLETDEVIDVTPGDLVTLHAGERTEWTVHDELVKVYVAR